MVRRAREPAVNYVADFETTTLIDDCRVWAWALCNISDITTEYGNSMGSFIERVSGESALVYFHNLAFDGSFILDFLLKNGYEHVTGKPMPGQFSTIIDLNGKFYDITVRWETGERTNFRDSLKKIPLSVHDIAIAYDLTEGKGDLDYTQFRPEGHELTDDELSYIRRDVEIVARAMDLQLSQGMTSMTVGADSLRQFKTFTPQFASIFPSLDLEVDADIRSAYRGGFTYAAPQFRGITTGPGRVYDVNSLYPSVMYDRLLPYGNPVWKPGAPEAVEGFPLFITSITFTATIKPDHIPCIQVKGSSYFMPAEYQTEISEPLTISVSSVDLALWRDQYDMNIISYNGCWYFKGVAGIFKQYIDKWMEVKATSTGGMRQIAKLHLNSLYGKFATNPDVSCKVPYVDGHDVVRFRVGDHEERKPVYTPVAVFITSYAREVTIRAAQRHYGVFAYADTDSLHLLVGEDPDDLDVHPTRLGAWKHESSFDAARFMRAKCYTEHFPECTCGELPHRRGCGYNTHIAGLPRAAAELVEFEDMVPGHVFEGKLRPVRVPGGIVLDATTYTLKI